MKASIFCLPSVGSRAEIEAGMAATRQELYQRMLKELTELVKLADDLGYDSVSFTEHHFHIEGFELSNNPVLLDLYFAMQTKRIRVGQLGIALPHQHDAIDDANRAAYEECFQIIKKCWTEPMLTHQGKYWKIPAGETPWTLETTAKYGTGVENGILKSVGVIPKPLQK